MEKTFGLKSEPSRASLPGPVRAVFGWAINVLVEGFATCGEAMCVNPLREDAGRENCRDRTVAPRSEHGDRTLTGIGMEPDEILALASRARNETRQEGLRSGRSWTLLLKRVTTCAGLFLLDATAHASETDRAAIPVLVTPVSTAAATASCQPIALPRNDARVVVSIYEIAQGATLPEHKDPFPRYAHVLNGTLRITNTETGWIDVYRTGDFIVEAIGQWHQARALDHRPVKLLVIDQVAGVSNTVITRK